MPERKSYDDQRPYEATLDGRSHFIVLCLELLPFDARRLLGGRRKYCLYMSHRFLIATRRCLPSVALSLSPLLNPVAAALRLIRKLDVVANNPAKLRNSR
jgi:hypothetical protein